MREHPDRYFRLAALRRLGRLAVCVLFLSLSGIVALVSSNAAHVTTHHPPSPATGPGVEPPIGATSSAESPHFDYLVEYRPASDASVIRVLAKGTGLPRRPTSARCELRNWGEWTTAAFDYVRSFRVDGEPLELSADGSASIAPHHLADGELVVTYELAVGSEGSPGHLQHPLLPYRTDRYLLGFVRNTLAGFYLDGDPVEGELRILIQAGADSSVFTGWAGLSRGSQQGWAPNPITSGNGVFVIGDLPGVTIREVESTRVEIVQLVDGPDATQAVASVAAAVLPSYGRATGRGARDSVRILIDRSAGATHTEAGIVVGMPDPGRLPDSVAELIAHELFHDWLGYHLAPEQALAWLKEGFTDYHALWHCAATGVTSPERFAERMLDIERRARASSALGELSFADPGVDWRDGDGPRETLAYRGGALLAFAIDVKLWRRSRRSVSSLVRSLLDRNHREVDLADVRAAMSSLDLDEVYDESIAGRGLPDAGQLLRAIGFEEVQVPKPLTYLGIDAEPASSGSPVPAVVTAVDPEGPAAATQLRPGDRILGLGPARRSPPELADEAPSRYRFGLTLVASGADTAVLDVERAGRSFRVEVEPRLVAGGRAAALHWPPGGEDGFFAPRP